MALERNGIRSILENAETSMDDKITAILDALHKEVDPLKDSLRTAQTNLSNVEKERDTAKSDKEAADKAFADYKAEQAKRDTRNKKVEAFKAFTQKIGMSKSFPDARDIKAYADEIDALELDDNGNAVNTEKLEEQLHKEKAGAFLKKETKSEPLSEPITNYDGITQKQFNNMSLDDKIKLKKKDPELYKKLRGGK